MIIIGLSRPNEEINKKWIDAIHKLLWNIDNDKLEILINLKLLRSLSNLLETNRKSLIENQQEYRK